MNRERDGFSLGFDLSNKARLHHVIKRDEVVIEIYHDNSLSSDAAKAEVRKLKAIDTASNYTEDFLEEETPYDELNPVSGVFDARIHGRDDGYHIKKTSCRKVASR